MKSFHGRYTHRLGIAAAAAGRRVDLRGEHWLGDMLDIGLAAEAADMDHQRVDHQWMEHLSPERLLPCLRAGSSPN
jgi:hypothetical protein